MENKKTCIHSSKIDIKQDYVKLYYNQSELPNVPLILGLGVSSILLNLIFIGVFVGIIGLSYANKSRNKYNKNPYKYIGYAGLKAGRLLNIIGIALGGISMLFFFIYSQDIIAYFKK